MHFPSVRNLPNSRPAIWGPPSFFLKTSKLRNGDNLQIILGITLRNHFYPPKNKVETHQRLIHLLMDLTAQNEISPTIWGPTPVINIFNDRS